jgi:hypothetical protein
VFGEQELKTPSYNTKVLLKLVSNTSAFVKLKISNNFKQNIDETHSKQLKSIGKSIPAYGF